MSMKTERMRLGVLNSLAKSEKPASKIFFKSQLRQMEKDGLISFRVGNCWGLTEAGRKELARLTEAKSTQPESPRTGDAKSEVIRLAKQMFGKNAIVEERPNALDAAGRKEELEKGKIRRARIEQLQAIIDGEYGVRRRVIETARGVVGIANDETMKELAEALTVYESIDNAIAERKQLREEGRKNNVHVYRCNVSQYDGSGPIPLSLHRADGDTWEEVLAKLKTQKA